MYDSTPYKPIAPSNSDNAAVMPSVNKENDNCAMESFAKPARVKTRYIGASGATSRTSARTSGAMVAARAVLITYAGDETVRPPSAVVTAKGK